MSQRKLLVSRVVLLLICNSVFNAHWIPSAKCDDYVFAVNFVASIFGAGSIHILIVMALNSYRLNFIAINAQSAFDRHIWWFGVATKYVRFISDIPTEHN